MRGISGKRVLIVDDNKSIRTMVAEYLGARGYDVLQAADGIQGLEYGLSSDANLIILDVVMPGIDGVRLCKLLREKGVTTPIIMLTEKATIRDKEAGYGVGVDDYLAKPFSPRELELRIESLQKRAQPGVHTRVRSGAGILAAGPAKCDLGYRLRGLQAQHRPPRQSTQN